MCMEANLDLKTARRLGGLALGCVHREYPNKLAHVLNSDQDVAPPRQLTPAFYGCYDWHSSVHGHWMLARLARTFPGTDLAMEAKRALGQSLTEANLVQEAKYMAGPGRASFERPYGLAWLLQLVAELDEWEDADARHWRRNLAPLEVVALARFSEWLSKLSHPVRSGEHSNTAFALGLTLDSARRNHHEAFATLIANKAKVFYLSDRDCPVAYEPSGEDFLSPCLAEADLMRRVLNQDDFASWLRSFLPGLGGPGGPVFSPAVSVDPSDGKLAHLDGLNLSRAWMLRGIASALPEGDPRRAGVTAMADAHQRDGLRAVTGEHYEGGHWLGSFAVYLVTGRGINHR